MIKIQMHSTTMRQPATVKDFDTFTSLDLYLTDSQGDAVNIDLLFTDKQGPMELVNAITAAINTREDA